MDEFDAASADTRVVQGLVWGPLRPAHTTDIRYTHTHTNKLGIYNEHQQQARDVQ